MLRPAVDPPPAPQSSAVLLGRGKRLYDDRTLASAFRLEESRTSSTGVFVARYVRDGEVRTGSFEPG